MTRLRTTPTRTLRTVAEAFLDTIGSPNTRRSYIALVKTVDAIDSRCLDRLIGHSRAWTRSPTPRLARPWKPCGAAWRSTLGTRAAPLSANG